MKNKFTDLEQLDLTEASALADLPELTSFDLISRLLFSSDYKIGDGTDGNVIPSSPASGLCKLQIGNFVKAGGYFYSVKAQATLNILTGTADPTNNIWGTGQAAHATFARRDIVCINFAYEDQTMTNKNFIDPTTIPPTEYTQSVNTRTERKYTISVLHGVEDGSLVEPALPSGFLKLASIYVAATVTTITVGDITNDTTKLLPRFEQHIASTAPSVTATDFLHSIGVFDGYKESLVTTEDSPASMNVVVGRGRLLGKSTAGVNYTADFVTFNTLTIGTANPTNPRYDLVQVNYVTNTMSIKPGVAAPSPSIPTPDTDNYALASVYVAAAVTTIVNANIGDLRNKIVNLNELVTARGTVVSLNTRLSASMYDDGRLREIQEVPTGSINGINVTFAISYAAQSNRIKLYRDGLRMTPSTDYSVSGTTITMVVAPATLMTMFVEYFRA